MAPRLTYAEWAGLVLSGMALGPHPESWGLVPVAAIAGVGLYALRRSDGFRAKVEDLVADMDELSYPEMALRLVEKLTVPPIGAQLALPSPKREPEIEMTEAHEGVPTLREGWEGLKGLWGDDNPRPRRQDAVRPGRPKDRGTRRLSNPEGRVTQQMVALREDEEWVRNAAPQLDLMPIRELVETVNGDPDTYPFVIVYGPPRSGKTTLAQLIALMRPGKVVILDPKRPQGWKDPKWGGLPYVSKDANGSYAPMVQALTMGYRLMERRYQIQETAQREFEPVTFIIDEAQVVLGECPEIAAIYPAILSKGAEARVQLILTSTTDRAGMLALKGKADNLDAFVPIRLGRFAQRVLPEVVDVSDNPKHWAVVNLGEWLPFDNSKTDKLLKRYPLRLSKVWSKVRYNCQVPRQDEDELDEQPVKRPTTARPVTAAKVTTPAPKPTPAKPKLDANEFLAGLLDIGEAGEVKSEVERESPSEVPNCEVGTSQVSNALPVTDMVLHTPSREEALEAVNLLKTVSREEGEVLQIILQLMDTGTSKSAAIAQKTGQSGGKTFKRMAQLVNAKLLLRRVRR